MICIACYRSTCSSTQSAAPWSLSECTALSLPNLLPLSTQPALLSPYRQSKHSKLNMRDEIQSTDLSSNGETGIRRKPWPKCEASAMLLLDKAASHTQTPDSWSDSPQAIAISLYALIWSMILDLVLLASSTAFLGFAFAVNSYDQTVTSEHLRAKEWLIRMSKYVSFSSQGDVNLLKSETRAHRFSPSYSRPSSHTPPMLS